MDVKAVKHILDEGRVYLGIELGSTRIKAVLIDEKHQVLASGNFDWENRLEGGYWTYDLELVHEGLRSCYASLNQALREQYGQGLRRLGGLGISAMMHGYLAFDRAGKQLYPFLTWRNSTANRASGELTELFQYNIPERWSIAHLYQMILEERPHVAELDYVTTLSGYVHRCLCGERVLGIGDAVGMFPMDAATHDYREDLVERFEAKIQGKGYSWRLRDIFPRVLCAGQDAGHLTAEGARLLDPSGELEPGAPMCPPEGDAATGMVATNSVKVRTGNVSAGTSIFAMIVLPHDLSRLYREIDMVTTPSGDPVAMVHCNNCTADIDAWVRIFREMLGKLGQDVPKYKIYDAFYEAALKADDNCGGLVSYNYLSGEFITSLTEGRPLFARMPDSRFSLENFARCQLFSAMATLRIGMELLDGEDVDPERLLGHGGIFKTPVVGQRLMASALKVPMAVMSSAGEGGAWGVAILAAYTGRPGSKPDLGRYLDEQVFAREEASVEQPDQALMASFDDFMARYRKGLVVEDKAVEVWR